MLSLLPAFGLAVVIGLVLSRAGPPPAFGGQPANVQRIVTGDLRERLPTRGGNDPFDQLAVSVNRMLGEIETLIQEIAGVGNDIAHDLRTPLTRVRGRASVAAGAGATTLEELRTVVDQSIAGLTNRWLWSDRGAVAHCRDRA